MGLLSHNQYRAQVCCDTCGSEYDTAYVDMCPEVHNMPCDDCDNTARQFPMLVRWVQKVVEFQTKQVQDTLSQEIRSIIRDQVRMEQDINRVLEH